MSSGKVQTFFSFIINMHTKKFDFLINFISYFILLLYYLNICIYIYIYILIGYYDGSHPIDTLPSLLKKIDDYCHAILQTPSKNLPSSMNSLLFIPICKNVSGLLHKMNGRALATYILESDVT